MSRIERGHFSSLLRRYLGMAGEAHVADELAPEISGVFVLEEERPEWEFLKGAKLMSATGLQAANAVLQSTFRIRNPAASGVVGVFTAFWPQAQGSEVNLFINNESADLAAVLGNAPLDSRYGTGGAGAASALVTSRANVAPGGVAWWSGFLFTNSQPTEIRVSFVLTPGFQIDCGTVQNNIDLRFTAYWLEKRLDALERQ